MTTFSFRVGGYISTIYITNSAKHSSKTYRRAGQRCFGLLALITVRFTGVLRTVGDGVLIQPPTRQEEVVMISCPVRQEGHCFLVI